MRLKSNSTLSARLNSGCTRRELMQRAGWFFASIALTPKFAPGNFGKEPPDKASASVTDVLSEYMSKTGDRALPDDVSEKTKHHILDTIGAMFSGADLPPGRVAHAYARKFKVEQGTTIVGSNVLCGPLEAALVNGMLAHSDETDDSHAPSHSHPGCGVVSAALVSGEYFGVDGTRFLRSVTLGYDIGTRVLMTLGGLAFQIQTHRSAHSMANTFGAAAAAACAARLTAQQMRWILDYSAQQASGIAAWQRDTEHIEKSLVFAGFPARNGTSTALMIQAGATGVDNIFAGPDNFLIAFASKTNESDLIDKLGERFEVTRTNIKKWSVGSPIQAPLDALQALIAKTSLRAQEVRSISVRVATSEAKTVNNREMPDICLQHMLAVMLLDKTVSFAAAHDKARMQDPEVLKQRAKVQLIPDEELERLYPKREAIIALTLHDGTHLTKRIEAVRGTAENPMTREEVIVKAHDLITPFAGGKSADALIDKILNIEKVKDIRELRPLLQVSK